ncbi:MAG: hypothetical protein ACRCUM_03155 [Mycoplasmoidaceae bacterium]
MIKGKNYLCFTKDEWYEKIEEIKTIDNLEELDEMKKSFLVDKELIEDFYWKKINPVKKELHDKYRFNVWMYEKILEHIDQRVENLKFNQKRKTGQ